MRKIGEKQFQVYAVNIGTLAYGLTAQGAPVDTMGFTDVLAVLLVGNCLGTATNAGSLVVKMQESATINGTGSAWSDITDGAVNGSFKFTTVALLANTTDLYQETMNERLGIGRKRFMRCHATLTGTDGTYATYSVAVLLGGAYDSDLCINAVTRSTGNDEFRQ